MFESDFPPNQLTFSPDGLLLAGAGRERGVEVDDVANGRRVARPPVDELARSVSFSPDGRLLFVGLYNGTGTFLSTEDWKPAGPGIRGHGQRILNPRFMPDGRTLATSSADGTVQLWDVASRRSIGGPLVVQRDVYVALVMSRDGSYLYALPTGTGGHAAGAHFTPLARPRRRDRGPRTNAARVGRNTAGPAVPGSVRAGLTTTAAIAASRSVIPSATRPEATYASPKQGQRFELEVPVAEPPGDRERRRGVPLALRRVARPRRPLQGEPTVRRALVHPFEQTLGSRHPPVRRGQVAADRDVQERQPARQLGGLHPPAAALIFRERARFQLDRPVVLTRKCSAWLRPSRTSAVSPSSATLSKQERAVSQSAAASACRPLKSIRGRNAHWALISGDTVTAPTTHRPALRGRFSSGLDELLPREDPRWQAAVARRASAPSVAARQGRPAPAADLLARIGDHHGVGLVAAARDLRPAGWLAVRDGGVWDGETVRR